MWRHAISGEFGWTRLLDVSTGPSESFCGKEGVTRTYSFCVFFHDVCIIIMIIIIIDIYYIVLFTHIFNDYIRYIRFYFHLFREELVNDSF